MKSVLITGCLMVGLLVGCVGGEPGSVSFTPDSYYDRVMDYCTERNEALSNGSLGAECGAPSTNCEADAEASQEWYRETQAEAVAAGCKAELDEGLECRLVLCPELGMDEACMEAYNACLEG